MNKTRKFSIKRTLLAFMLIAALIGVQVIEIVAYAADERTADQQEIVEVSTYDELVAAIDAAQDGDVIGLTATIETSNSFSIGSPDKHVTIKRMDAYAFFQLSGGADIFMNFENITFDGSNIEAGHNYLIVGSSAAFKGCNFINCISNGSGGALYVTVGTEFRDCTFNNNKATNGGHVAISGTAPVAFWNSTLKNGHAKNQGGAIHTATPMINLHLMDSVITENHSESFGGAIVSNGFVRTEGSKVFNNTAVNGGADIVSFGTMELFEDLEKLQALYGENYIINGWVSDYEDPDAESGASYLKLDYEVIPTEVILAESSLGFAGDSKITGLEADKHYKVSFGETVSYSKADGTLTLDEAESQPLTGTEITGLTNGQVYLVEEYTKPTTPDPEPSTVILVTDSLGAAGNGKITDLPSGKKYKVSSDGVISYSKSDGTLTSQESDASELVGTEIVGLTNGKTYKVEEYISTPTLKPDEPKNEVTTPPTNNSTSNTTTNNDNSSIRHDNSETKNDYSTVNNYYTTDSSTHTSTTKTEAPKPSDESVVAVMTTTSPSPSTSEPVTQDDVNAEKVSEAASAFKNIRIEANGADCIFEINEDGYNISINANGNSQAAASSSTSSMNWYELVKICLLAAIAVTLLWKPRKVEKSDLI